MGRARHLLVEVLGSLYRAGRLARDDGRRHLLTQEPVPIHLAEERIAPELNGTVTRAQALARIFGEQPSEEALSGRAHVLRKLEGRVRDALEERRGREEGSGGAGRVRVVRSGSCDNGMAVCKLTERACFTEHMSRVTD